MTRAATRWLFRTWPPAWTALAAILAYAFFSAPYAVTLVVAPHPGAERLLDGRDVLLSTMAAAYALFRVIAFHPAARDDYRLWLVNTPWRAGIPLPAGPVHLVPQDLVALALLVAARHGTLAFEARHGFGIAMPMMLTFQAALVPTLWRIGYRGQAYGLAVGIAVSLRLFLANPWWGLAACAVMTVLAVFASTRSLRTFPWHEWIAFTDGHWQRASPPRRAGGSVPAAADATTLGWPFSTINALDFPPLLRPLDKLAISATVGLFAHVLVAAVDMAARGPDDSLGLGLVGMAAVVAAATRFVACFKRHRPPISLWGRLRTGRWIIPAYDRMFVAPLAIVVAAGFLPMWLRTLHAPSAIADPVALAVVLVIAQLTGPSLRQWSLTAPCRIDSGFSPYWTGSALYERI